MKPTESRISVVLADDHVLVRQGIRALLERQRELELVGETGDGLEAIRLVDELQPDVLVLDIGLPGLNGLDVAREISRQSRSVHVVMLSMHGDETCVLAAFRNGAVGYVLKESCADDLVQAVREAAAGRRYLSTALSDVVLRAFVEKTGAPLPDSYERLTGRERQIVQLAAEGHTSRQIARRLFISPRTVEAHRARMLHKLGLRTQTDLVLYAVRRGLMPLARSPRPHSPARRS